MPATDPSSLWQQPGWESAAQRAAACYCRHYVGEKPAGTVKRPAARARVPDMRSEQATPRAGSASSHLALLQKPLRKQRLTACVIAHGAAHAPPLCSYCLPAPCALAVLLADLT